LKNALIAAVIAAIVAAASGTAATYVVTSKNIKNGTIQTVDLSKKARKALKGHRGPRGYDGTPGEAGPPGAPGATNVTVRTWSLSVGPLADAWAFILCPEGQRATGGGAHAVPGLLVYDTHPTNASGNALAAGETPVGWRVGVDSYLNSSQTVTAYAVCAAP
jgi:hypothetical protein